MPVTPRQRDYLRAISRISARLGYSPTLREVAEEVSSAVQTTASMMLSLERRGYIARDVATPRSMRLTELGRDAVREAQ